MFAGTGLTGLTKRKSSRQGKQLIAIGKVTVCFLEIGAGLLDIPAARIVRGWRWTNVMITLVICKQQPLFCEFYK